MPPIEEKDLYQAFGLEMPKPEDAPEVSESANTAEVAGGGEDQNANNREAEKDKGTGTENPPAQETMSMDDRARFAEMRRKRETEAAVQKALQEQDAKNRDEWQKFFAASGMKDANGNPITTREQYEAAQQEQKMREVTNNLKRGTLKAEDLQTMIRREMAENATADETLNTNTKGQAEEKLQSNQPEDNVTEEMVLRELEEISRLDPNVRTLEDILKLETGKDFAAEVKRGASFLNAFKIANFDRLQQKQREESASRAKQAALNSQRGKEHLNPSTSKGSGSVPVPAEELALYRRLNPKATDAEISAHYNKTVKQLK